MLKYLLAFLLSTLLATATSSADQPVLPQVKVTGCTIDSAYTHALAETIAAARDFYADLGFNMPQAVSLSIKCKDGAQADLFNDGRDQIFLTIPSQAALAPPAKSGTFNIYGMCHELGHLAMYRTLKDRDWLANDAAEGWAHYIGSVAVDHVFAAKGKSLWPEPYDYLQDGTARLQGDIASKSPSDMIIAAEQWQKLGAVIGLRGFPPLFAAWQLAGIDPVRPSKPLLDVIDKMKPQSKVALTDWWHGAAPVIIEKLQVSEFPVQQTSPEKLSGHTVELPMYPETETGRMSYAGTGTGRKFTAPSGGNWYIKAVWIYGSRYGEEKPPDTLFDIALGDGDARPITLWKGGYAPFPRGNEVWARFDVLPTRLPPNFYVMLNFHATGSNGVYVGFDSATKGSSIDSLPGKPIHDHPDGDWMIRVELDHPK